MMGFFSNLFAKQNCAVCGKECGTLHRSKLRDGQFLCDDCGNKCSKYIRLSELTLDEAKEHMEYMARMKRVFDEVFNKTESYPRAFDYAVQYGLVPFANSDIHYMSGSIYPVRGSRPMTLVFATARTAGAIHEALLAGRALACFDGNLMGRGEYIGQMIDAALEIREIRQVSKTKRTFEIANKSDLRFAVRPASYDYPMPVYAGQGLRIDIRQGEQVEFTNCILGKGRYYTRIFWE